MKLLKLNEDKSLKDYEKEWEEQKGYKTCDECGTRLNDQGTCPKCNDGEEDLDEAYDPQELNPDAPGPIYDMNVEFYKDLDKAIQSKDWVAAAKEWVELRRDMDQTIADNANKPFFKRIPKFFFTPHEHTLAAYRRRIPDEFIKEAECTFSECVNTKFTESFKKILNEDVSSGWAIFATDLSTGKEYCAGVYNTENNAHYWAAMDEISDREYGYGQFKYRVEKVEEYTSDMAASANELNRLKIKNYDGFEDDGTLIKDGTDLIEEEIISMPNNYLTESENSAQVKEIGRKLKEISGGEKTKWCSTAGKVIEEMPDEYIDQFFAEMKKTFGSRKLTDKEKQQLSDTFDGQVKETEELDTIEKIIDFFNTGKFFEKHPTLAKYLTALVIFIIGVVAEPSPIVEIISIIVAMLPAEWIGKIYRILFTNPAAEVAGAAYKKHKDSEKDKEVNEAFGKNVDKSDTRNKNSNRNFGINGNTINLNFSGNTSSGNSANMDTQAKVDAKVAEVNPQVAAEVNPEVAANVTAKADGASVGAAGGVAGATSVVKEEEVKESFEDENASYGLSALHRSNRREILNEEDKKEFYFVEIVPGPNGKNEYERYVFSTLDEMKARVKEMGLKEEDIDSCGGCEIKQLFEACNLKENKDEANISISGIRRKAPFTMDEDDVVIEPSMVDYDDDFDLEFYK